MPTYVYECAKCGDEFEVWQSITDDALKRHGGTCRGKLAKVIQPAGIVLKGSGFYKNDSKSSSKRSSSGSGDTKSGDGAGESSSAAAASDSPSGSKPDTKTAAATKSEPSKPGGSSGNGSGAKKPAKATSSP